MYSSHLHKTFALHDNEPTTHLPLHSLLILYWWRCSAPHAIFSEFGCFVTHQYQLDDRQSCNLKPPFYEGNLKYNQPHIITAITFREYWTSHFCFKSGRKHCSSLLWIMQNPNCSSWNADDDTHAPNAYKNRIKCSHKE